MSLLEAAKKFSNGEITYINFSEYLDNNPQQLAKVLSNYHYELMRAWKMDELQASLNNLSYLIEQYSSEEEKEQV